MSILSKTATLGFLSSDFLVVFRAPKFHGHSPFLGLIGLDMYFPPLFLGFILTAKNIFANFSLPTPRFYGLYKIKKVCYKLGSGH
jgi:hypothetical protein